MPDTLLRVIAPHFVAGVVLRDNVVVRAAPILWRALHGKTKSAVRRWAAERCYRIEAYTLRALEEAWQN